MIFHSREEAAEQLALRLSTFRGRDPLILAIPRGSVGMGKVLADRLHGDLDVVLVRKVGAPGNPEFAIGAVTEAGDLIMNEDASYLDISEDVVKSLASAELLKLRERRAQYTPLITPLDPRGRTVLIVDDGIATGSTMLAAIQSLRARLPREIVVCTPVAARSVVASIAAAADHLVALHTPDTFMSVGRFYEEFPQVTDEEVTRILTGSRIRIK